MKKYVAFLCTLTLVLPLLYVCPVYAEDQTNAYIEGLLDAGMTVESIAEAVHTDRPFSCYSTDALMVLYLAFGFELQAQGIQVGVELTPPSDPPLKEVTVPVGTYVVGKDIPAGDYTVTYNGRLQSAIYIYPNEDSIGGFDFDFHLLNPTVLNNNSIGKLSLTDGQVVEITYGDVVFSPYKGLGF